MKKKIFVGVLLIALLASFTSCLTVLEYHENKLVAKSTTYQTDGDSLYQVVTYYSTTGSPSSNTLYQGDGTTIRTRDCFKPIDAGTYAVFGNIALLAALEPCTINKHGVSPK